MQSRMKILFCAPVQTIQPLSRSGNSFQPAVPKELRSHSPPYRVFCAVAYRRTAHPDDEVIGAGSSLLSHFGRSKVVHVTEGAPANMLDAQRAGFVARNDYAHARRLEVRHDRNMGDRKLWLNRGGLTLILLVIYRAVSKGMDQSERPL